MSDSQPNMNAETNPRQSNIYSDSLDIASLDHPGMLLTNTPFNGNNFYGCSHTIKMVLGA